MREISEMAEVYFAAHWEELITRAIADCWRLPEFVRHRQTQPNQ